MPQPSRTTTPRTRVGRAGRLAIEQCLRELGASPGRDTHVGRATYVAVEQTLAAAGATLRAGHGWRRGFRRSPWEARDKLEWRSLAALGARDIDRHDERITRLLERVELMLAAEQGGDWLPTDHHGLRRDA
jgi:hypothetical protein